MTLTPDDLRAFAKVFEDTAWQELTIGVGGAQLHLSRRPQAPVPSRSPGINGTDGERTELPVTAPSVGVIRRGPALGAPPFVEIGARVGVADTVASIETFKAVNPIPAGVAGVITAIVVEDGGVVEYGQPVVLVEPQG